MKKILLACLFALGLSILFSCEKDDSARYSKLIIGEWGFVKEEYVDKDGNVTTFSANDYREQLPDGRSFLKTMKFTKELCYWYYVDKDEIIVGTDVAQYHIDESNNILWGYAIIPIVELSKTSLVIDFDEARCYFKRIK